MAFCLNYNRHNPYMNQVDEIVIKFHKSTTLLDFLKEHKDQRIIISIEDGKAFIEEGGINYFKLIKQMCDNWVLRFPSMFDEKTITLDQCHDVAGAALPFFFNDYIDKWDVMYGYFALGVSDIYITNELGFELDKISKIAKEKNIKIRVLPNVAQSSWFDTDDLRKFFIRPEDIENYLPYVDVFEFYETDPSKPQVGSILYKAYAKDKRWYGKLNEIIDNFSGELDGRFTHPHWVDRRTSCAKRCLKGGHCRACLTIGSFANTLKKAGITVEKPEEKTEVSKEELEENIRKYYGVDVENHINLDDILTSIEKQ